MKLFKNILLRIPYAAVMVLGICICSIKMKFEYSKNEYDIEDLKAGDFTKVIMDFDMD